MARESFLDRLEIPSSQIHPIPYLSDAAIAAEDYAKTLQHSLPSQSGIPRFDLVWLGMGDDGHTASLFPGCDLLNDTSRYCGATYVEKMASWRISLTFPVINNADNVLLLVNGAAKARRLAEVLDGGENRYPVQSVAPRGNLYWLLDAAAASDIEWATLDKQWRILR